MLQVVYRGRVVNFLVTDILDSSMCRVPVARSLPGMHKNASLSKMRGKMVDGPLLRVTFELVIEAS